MTTTFCSIIANTYPKEFFIHKNRFNFVDARDCSRNSDWKNTMKICILYDDILFLNHMQYNYNILFLWSAIRVYKCKKDRGANYT